MIDPILHLLVVRPELLQSVDKGEARSLFLYLAAVTALFLLVLRLTRRKRK